VNDCLHCLEWRMVSRLLVDQTDVNASASGPLFESTNQSGTNIVLNSDFRTSNKPQIWRRPFGDSVIVFINPSSTSSIMTRSFESFLCRTFESALKPGFTNFPSSPIPHLLGTNSVPSEAESQEIRELIAAVQADISRLDANIMRARVTAQPVLKRLIEERKALKEYASEHAAFLTPARRLPAEIWSEIFSHCLPECFLREFGDRRLRFNSWTFSPRDPPEVFLQVCNDWKSIALSSPRLWSSIPLYRSSRFGVPPRNIMENWLRRSDPTSLSVIFELDQEVIACPAATAVLQQSHRWRLASIRIPIYFWSPFSLSPFSALKNNLPDLEELHVEFDSTSSTDAHGILPVPPHIMAQIDILSHAPKLRRVALGNAPSYKIADIKLPWAQLTHFSSNYFISYNQLAALLRSVPHLLEVELSLARVVQTAYPPVQHSHLQNLSLHILGDPGFVFDNLSMPSLRTLSISTSEPSWYWAWRPFETFMSRNCPSLDSFKVTSLSVKGSEVVACLTALPSLRHFRLVTLEDVATVQCPLQEILKALCWPVAENGAEYPIVLPTMKSIKLNCFVRDDSQVSMIVGMFLDMVESRWTPGHSDTPRIESASLNLCCWPTRISPGDIDRIQRLNSEGLAVTVTGMYIDS
jgi:hypothetical protein